MKKIVKIPAIAICVLIILAVAIRLILPWAAVEIANRKLPGILNTEASIGGLSLGLLRGYVSIRDLRIAQPEGFGEGDLLLVPAVSLKVRISSLLSPPLTVEEVRLDDWEVNLVKNRDGVMNLEAILPPAPESEETPAEEPAKAAKPILVRAFIIENLSFSYVDRAITAAPGEVIVATGEEGEVPLEGAVVDEPEIDGQTGAPPAGGEKDEEEEVLRIEIAGLDLKIDNLLIDPAADPAAVEPAAAVLTARIIQEPFADGLLGLAARIGPVGTGLPPLNAVLRLGALELKPIDVVIPAGTTQALGGSALDLDVNLALASYLLDCEIDVEVAGGHVIPLAIGGTPDRPEVDTSSILFGVMLHLGGGMGRMVGNIGGAGYQLAA
ncbi:MAG: AsmA family protein, partial [Candidatus Erginobacter occultus]|nr:AsmA family protein [Candidatus Erginobacter occultus]